MVLHGENLAAVVIIFVTSLLVVFSNGWSILVVTANNKLTAAVRVYFIGDSLARIIASCIVLFFAIPCAFLSFCVEIEDVFTVGWLINRICGYCQVSLIFSTKFFTLALALNRFLAIFRKGQYYRRAGSHVVVQTVALTLIPFLLLSPLMLDGEAYYYDPANGGWWYYGYNWAELVIANIDYDITIAIWVLVIFLDTTTALSIRMLMSKTANSSVKKMDVQIMKQVCSFHAVSLAYFIMMRVFDMNHSWDNWSQLESFCFYDFIPAVIDILAGISRVYYLRVRNAKRKETSILSVTKSTLKNTFSTIHLKTVTSMTS